MTDLRAIGEQSQARYIAQDKRDYEEAVAMVEQFMRAHGLAGAIDPVDLSTGRLPSRELNLAVGSIGELKAWDEAARPFQLKVYNGIRSHPANPPITDEEDYLLVRNGAEDGVIGGAAAGAQQPVPPGWTLWVRNYPQGRMIFAFPRSDADLVPGRHNSFTIPARRGLKPETSTVVPHLQMTDVSPPEIRQALLDWIATTPEFERARKIGPSDVAEPTSIAIFLGKDLPSPNARSLAPSLRANGYEPFHVHEDGGLHIALSEEDRWEVLAKKWAEPHPVARWGVNAVLLYAPRDEYELEIIKKILVGAYRYAMGDFEGVEASAKIVEPVH